MAGFTTDIGLYNQGRAANPNFNFMMRVEGIFDLPCRRVHSFTKANEYEYIQEGGLNDYVHMRRKPISQPFTFQVERYVGVDILDPLQPGTDLILPIVLMVWRMQMNNNFTPYRIYTFTGCNVMSKEYGELNAEQSGLLVETTTIGYRELIRVTTPDFMFNANGTTNAFADYSQSAIKKSLDKIATNGKIFGMDTDTIADKLAHQQRNAKRSQYDHTRPEKRPGFNDGKFDFKDYEEKNKKKDKKPVYARQFSDPRGINYETGKPKTKRPKYSDGAEYAFKKYAEENKAKDKKPKYARQWSDPRGIDHETGKPKAKRPDFSDGADFKFKEYDDANKAKDKKPVYARQLSDPRGINHETGKPKAKRPNYSDGAEFEFKKYAADNKAKDKKPKYARQWSDPRGIDYETGKPKAKRDDFSDGAEFEFKKYAEDNKAKDKKPKYARQWSDPRGIDHATGKPKAKRDNFSDGAEFEFKKYDEENKAKDKKPKHARQWSDPRGIDHETGKPKAKRPNFSDGAEFDFETNAGKDKQQPVYSKFNYQDPPTPEMWPGGDAPPVRAKKLPGAEAAEEAAETSTEGAEEAGEAAESVERKRDAHSTVGGDKALAKMWPGVASGATAPYPTTRAKKLPGAEDAAGSEGAEEAGEAAESVERKRDAHSTVGGDKALAEMWPGVASGATAPYPTTRAKKLPGAEAAAGSEGAGRSNFSDGEFQFSKTALEPTYAKSNDQDPPAPVMWTGGDNVRANKLEGGGGGGSRSDFSDGEFAFGGTSPDFANTPANDSQRAEKVLWEGGANVRANQLEGGAAGGSRSDFSDGEFTFGGKAPAFANASPNDAQRAQKVLWEGGKQNVRANKKKEGGGGGSRSSFSDGKFAFGGKSPSYAKSSSTDSQRAEQVLWEGWQQGPKGSTATKRAKMADLLK